VAHESVLSATVVRSSAAGTNNYLLVDIIALFMVYYNIKDIFVCAVYQIISLYLHKFSLFLT